MTRLLAYAGSGWLLSFAWAMAPGAVPAASAPQATAAGTDGAALFTPAGNCIACHNRLTTPSGEDVSIGIAWRATIMANSARDPYWQASVRRETIDHPSAGAAIEEECSVCHMPMSHTAAHAEGRKAQIFAHLPVAARTDPLSRLAHDGVSCALCHQITPQRLGTAESFNGGYVIDTTTPPEQRRVFGPYPPEAGLVTVMHSVTGFVHTEGAHMREAALCATCHTLYTTALGPDGQAVGRLPEQVPFLEWQHSEYAAERTCQSCHMPAIDEPAPVASVLGPPRTGAGRHTFLGGNFFMLRMLNRFRGELGTEALPHELESAAQGTLAHLRDQTARLTIDRAAVDAGRLVVDLTVENRTGHKLPTAYPARRAWIHLTVRDAGGRVVFESGRVGTDGAIAGNDNDADAARFEPHYRRITAADQVQIYESILEDAAGGVTTGLLKGVGYLKDNRLLPRGFDKATAVPDIAVQGDAAGDDDFRGGTDRVQYAVDLADARGPVTVEAELLFQPIGFRWAHNLEPYTHADEPARFVSYFKSLSSGSSAPLATAVQIVR